MKITLISYRMTAVTIISLIFLFFSTNSKADYKYFYHDYDEIIAVLQDLEAQSNAEAEDIFSLQVIGESYLGNPIYAAKISDNPGIDEEDEPDIVFDSGIHANEWLPVESNVNFMEHIFYSYYDSLQPDHAEVVDLVNNFEIWFIPVINPDGRMRDDQNGGDPSLFWTSTYYHPPAGGDGDQNGWRMNVQEVPCPARLGGTNQGIDLNRSWSWKFWELSDCLSTIYSGGDKPFIPPETRALKNFINNHMISFVLHQHSAIGTFGSNSSPGFDPLHDGLGKYITVEMDNVYEEDGLPYPLLTINNEVEQAGGARTFLPGSARTFQPGSAKMGYEGEMPFRARELLLSNSVDPDSGVTMAASGACSGSGMSGQYYVWLWLDINCILSSDDKSRRSIQSVMYEYPVKDTLYGHPSQGKIGQYMVGDGSNFFHPSSGEVIEWIIGRSVPINKYLIKQSKYPFSPRYHTDMSRRPEAPDVDLALVGAKISEVGSGLPGCFTYRESDARDMIEYGPKRVTWNLQNNGADNRTINTDILICNQTENSCIGPITLTSSNVPPETIETFTYDYAFTPISNADYSLTITTGEDNSLGNDKKKYVFSVIGPCRSDVDNNTKVNIFDLIKLKNEYNSTGCSELNPCEADINGDGNVNIFDLIIMKNEYNRTDCVTP